MPTEPLVLVRTTVATAEQARAIARALVEGGLAACVHVHPIQSTYRWEGATVEEAEVLVEARVLREREVEARRRMAEGHPYALPLIESLPVEVNRDYAAWAESPH